MSDARPPLLKANCLTDQDYRLYITGKVSEEDKARIDSHLSGCERCCQELAYLMLMLYNEITGEEKGISEPRSGEIDRLLKVITSGRKAAWFGIWPKAWPAMAWRKLSYALLLLVVLAAAVTVGAVLWPRRVVERDLLAKMSRQSDELASEGVSILRSVYDPGDRLRLASSLMQVGERPRQRASDSASSYGRKLNLAENKFEQALILNPNNPLAHLGLGYVYLGQRQPQEAAEKFRRVLALDENNLDAICGLGAAIFEQAAREKDIHRRDELMGSALACFERALKLDSRRLEALYNQAIIYYELGQKDKALEKIDAYLTSDSSSDWAEKLREIKQRLRLSSFKVFEQEVWDRFRKGDLLGLERTVRLSSHAPRLIRDLLSKSLGLEASGDLPQAQDAFACAEAVESCFSKFTGDGSYKFLLSFHRSLSPQQKRIKLEADALLERAKAQYRSGDLDEVFRLTAAALPLYAQIGDHWRVANLHHGRGNAFFLTVPITRKRCANTARC